MHEPSGVILTAEFAAELEGRKAFLAGGVQMERCGPLCEFEMAALDHRASRDSEVLAAGRGTTAVSAQLLRGVVLGTPALRADRTVWPARRLKPHSGGILVMEMWLGEFVLAGHWIFSYGLNPSISGLWCQLRSAACETHRRTHRRLSINPAN